MTFVFQIKSTILDEQSEGFSLVMPYLKDRNSGKTKKVVPKPARESLRRMLEIYEKGRNIFLDLYGCTDKERYAVESAVPKAL